MDIWGLEFDPVPYSLEGQKINGSNIVMGNKNGKRATFSMDCNGNDFDRNI